MREDGWGRSRKGAPVNETETEKKKEEEEQVEIQEENGGGKEGRVHRGQSSRSYSKSVFINFQHCGVFREKN